MKPNKKEKRQGSLLTRFFKKDKAAPKKRPETAKKTTKKADQNTPSPPSPPSSAVERSIVEIKQLVAIGKKDPQRLALLVGNMLEAEKEQQLADKEAFDQLLEEIANRKGDSSKD